MTYDEFKQNFLPELNKINSYAGRLNFAKRHLQGIGSGSGRAVFDIDGEKVLKLAKNAKGIAQNDTESSTGTYHDTQDIVAIVFDYAEDDSWIVSEKAKKVNEKRIKEITGIPSLYELRAFLQNAIDSNHGRKPSFKLKDGLKEFFWENEFSYDLIDFAVNYNQEVGDMGRPSTYGEVLRDGQPTIVLTDYGLNDEVYKTYYSREPVYELYNFADGNDDILSDAGGGMDIRHGMWAQIPYSVSDGDGVINERFINFINNRSTYPDKPVEGLPLLTDKFHECVNNLKETLKHVENKKQFYNNLLELQNYLIRRGMWDRQPALLPIDEDGSAKFSTNDAIGQDGFPIYNNIDTSPSINNDLDANIAMYEDLIYKHVVGNATDDEYMLDERNKSFGTGSKTVNVKKKCQLAGLGNTSVACNQGDINNLEFGSVKETIDIDTVNGYDDNDMINSMIRGDKDVGFLRFDGKYGDYVKKQVINNNFKSIPIKQSNHNSDIRIVYRDTPRGNANAKRLVEILNSHGGYFNDQTPEEAIEIGRLLDYSEKSINQYIRRRYPKYSQLQVQPEPNIDDLDYLDEYYLEIKEYFSSLVPQPDENVTNVENDRISDMINETNIMSLQNLPFKKEIENIGGQIFSVGGAVRDEFLGKESKDLDVLITGVPMNTLEQVLSKYGAVNAVGKSFGVIKFIPKGASEEIDIAIPRTEVPTGDGGHKGFDVTSDHELPIEKDLERRDFTINAIAKDINGNLIDPFNGQEDLKNKIIRVVNPEAFSDDPLRMLRAVQFASRFGFTIEPKTMEMIKDNAAKITEIAPERILIELDKIITKGQPYIGIELLSSTGLFKQIFGNEIKPSQIGRRDFSSVKTMAEFLFFMMDGVVQNPSEFYLKRFSTEDAKRDKIYKELQALDLAFNSNLIDQNMSPVKARTIAHNMYSIAPQTLESQILPEPIRTAANELLQGKYPKTTRELAVNGNDLMQRGLQGKEIGDMQKSMLIRIYDDKIRNDKEELLSLVTKKNNEIQETNNNEIKSWNINGKQETIDFFVKKYDVWNKQGGKDSGYSTPSKESVLEFLQNNYEDESTNESLKRNLFNVLIDRDLLGEEMEKKQVYYSAVVLDDKSRANLLRVFSPMIPEGWETIAHHMTIKLGALEDGSQAQEDMENNVEISLRVTDYAIDDLVMAVGVEGYNSTNKKPHITIAVNRAEGGKPYMSNKLQDWKPIKFPLNLTGKVSEE